MEPSTRGAPFIPHEKLPLSLQHYCFDERMVGALQNETGFGQLQYRSHQICFVHNFAERDGNQTETIMQLSRAFGCHPIASNQRSITGARQMFGVVIWPLMNIEKLKFWNIALLLRS
jgi:hypothetical protein